MLTKFDFTNNNGETFSFNTDAVPLHRVEPELEGRSADINKMQQHGNWPTFNYFGKLLIHTEGRILADDSAGYNTIAFEMRRTIYPNPTVVVADRKLGVLTLGFDGITEDLVADTGMDGDISLPMIGGYSAMGEFQITWKVFAGYFLGAVSGQYYWI